MKRIVSQLSQLVNVYVDRPVNLRVWRLWVMAILALILGDHLGLWELHDLFADGIDIHEVGVIVAAIGALFTSLTGKE